MPADAGDMLDDLAGRLDLPQGAARMPRPAAWIALRLAAQAPRALFGNLLDGRFRQAVARGRHAAVAAVLAQASQEFLDPLLAGEIERSGFREFPVHRDDRLDQLALGRTTEIVGMMARTFHDGMRAYCSQFANAMCAGSGSCGLFATSPYPCNSPRRDSPQLASLNGLGVPE